MFKTKKVSNKCQKCNSFDNPTLQNKKVEWVLASSTISLLLHYTKDLKVNKDLKKYFSKLDQFWVLWCILIYLKLGIRMHLSRLLVKWHLCPDLWSRGSVTWFIWTFTVACSSRLWFSSIIFKSFWMLLKLCSVDLQKTNICSIMNERRNISSGKVTTKGQAENW